MNRVISYPMPVNAVGREDYRVYVRPVGEQAWTEIFCYEVKVDMHEVREASMACFDFEGKVEVKVYYQNYMDIYSVDIRPLSRKIKAEFTEREIFFTLEEPANLSVEINGDRFHNLHLFAGPVKEDIPDTAKENRMVLAGNLEKAAIHNAEMIAEQLKQMPAGRVLYFEPGVHYLEECILTIPSDTEVYLAGGAVVIGSFVCSRVENVKIHGRGVVYMADFHRFMALRGVRLSHVKGVEIEGITFINPPHYTIYLGNAEHVLIKNIKSFSCEGWSDGIDMMSSQDITIENVFMRNSDDCVAIYASRWECKGDTRNIVVKNSVLWADVAHPTNIGCHGDFESDGDILENIQFEDIDILEHHEPQKTCLGCLCINAGDKNTVRNVKYENIRIEHIEHGKVLDLCLIQGKYNPVSGRRIENILFKDIYYNGSGEVTSLIQGVDSERMVENVSFENFVVRGKHVKTAKEANVYVGAFASGVKFR